MTHTAPGWAPMRAGDLLGVEQGVTDGGGPGEGEPLGLRVGLGVEGEPGEERVVEGAAGPLDLDLKRPAGYSGLHISASRNARVKTAASGGTMALP
jgi:hypothetical protein